MAILMHPNDPETSHLMPPLLQQSTTGPASGAPDNRGLLLKACHFSTVSLRPRRLIRTLQGTTTAAGTITWHISYQTAYRIYIDSTTLSLDRKHFYSD